MTLRNVPIGKVLGIQSELENAVIEVPAPPLSTTWEFGLNMGMAFQIHDGYFH